MSIESGLICLKNMSGSEGRKSPTTLVSEATAFDKPWNKVREYVRQKGIMLEDKFHEYDTLREGYVTKNDFAKACTETFREILSDEEVEELQTHYCHLENPSHCDWPKFLHDVESEMNAHSQCSELSKEQQKELVLQRVARTLKSRTDVKSLLAKVSFGDKTRNEIPDDDIGTNEDLLQILGKAIEKDDLKIIVDIYTDGMGFKYQEFVRDLKETEDLSVRHSRQPLSKYKGTFSLEIPDHQTQSTPKTRFSGIRRHRRRFSISYESLVWIVFLAVTTLCVVDHFVLKGDVVLGRGRRNPRLIWGTSIGETAANIIWAVTARLIIPSQNLMFYTMLWCFPNFLSEIAPRWITIKGIRDVHVRIHRIAGIFLIAIPTLAHVLVMFVPPLVDGTALIYYPPSAFNYSTYPDHLNWSTFWDPAAVHDWTYNDHNGVHITSDEIYRLVLMIALFCIFFPLSRSQYVNQRSYSLAMALHAFAGIWYAIDNIRKMYHGLSRVVNLPLLLIWCLDRVLSIWVYRRQHGHIVRKEVIGNNEYVIVYIKLDKKVTHAVGDVYYTHHFIRESVGVVPQRSHPFTTFFNLSQDTTWDIGLVTSIIQDGEQLFLPWTSWLADDDRSCALHTWGPYRSSVSRLYDELTEESERGEKSPAHYVLFATGSGCGYLLDVLSSLAYGNRPFFQGDSQKDNKRCRIEIYYSVRCQAFFRFFSEPIEELLRKIKAKGNISINFNFYVTNPDDQPLPNDTRDTQIKLKHGRINFEKALRSASKNSKCYFVGRPAIAAQVEEICLKKGIDFIKDYTNGQGGQQDRHVLINYLKISFWVIFFIAAVCVVVGLLIDVRAIKNNLRSHSSPITNTSGFL
ncbi:uncharacterized protein [Montipora foliosa]|uniref:uncharacterized protein n=1 Tax=Montipora foliosa TaxID=591990 RepID=UPI0035F1B074